MVASRYGYKVARGKSDPRSLAYNPIGNNADGSPDAYFFGGVLYLLFLFRREWASRLSWPGLRPVPVMRVWITLPMIVAVIHVLNSLAIRPVGTIRLAPWLVAGYPDS